VGARLVSALLRALTVLFAVDLVLNLVTGGYTIPLVGIRSHHPCTPLFAILVLEILRRAFDSRSGRGPRLRDSDVFLFLLIWAAFLANFRWRGAGDVVGASLLPFSILQEGDLFLDEYRDTFLAPEWTGSYERNGHTLTKYPSAPGVLLVPFYLVPALAGVTPDDLLLHQLQKIGASFMVALSAILVLCTLQRYASRSWAVVGALAYALGTSSLSTSSQAIWQHGPAQLFVSLGLFLLARGPNVAPAPQDGTNSSKRAAEWKRGAGAGFAFAMATWNRYPNVFLCAAAFLYVVMRERRLAIPFLIGTLPAFAALAADNVLHTGSPFATGYGAEAAAFSNPLGTGLAGLLISPGRGILLFSPFLAFSLIGFAMAWRKPGDALLRALSLGCAAELLAYSKWHAWTGGWCFGPRFLADMMPALVFALHPTFRWLDRSKAARLLIDLSVALSVLMHVLGAVLTWWWEELDDAWIWDRHPIVYLLRRAPGTGDADQILARWIVVVLLAGIGVWFTLRRRGSFGPRGERSGIAAPGEDVPPSPS
jgi:hypothetical protein